MEKKFYTANGTQVLGPLSLNELMAMRITPDTLLFTHETGEWKNASSFPEVAARMGLSQNIQQAPLHQQRIPQLPPHPQQQNFPQPPPHPQQQAPAVQQYPMPNPVAQQKTTQAVQQQPMPAPVTQQKTTQAVQQQPMPAPVTQQKTTKVSQLPHQPKVVNLYQIYDEETDETKGPFLVSELLANGLTVNSQVLCEGMDQWKKAYLVEELQPLFPKEELDKKRHRMFAHPFSYKGRITRTEYWISTAIALLFLSIVLALLAFADNALLLIPIIMVQILVLWFWTAQGSKRCHDFSENGYAQFSFLFCLTYYYGKDIFVEDGVPFDNEYGPDPKEYKRHLITEEQSEKRDKLIRIIYYVCITILLALTLSLRFLA